MSKHNCCRWASKDARKLPVGARGLAVAVKNQTKSLFPKANSKTAKPPRRTHSCSVRDLCKKSNKFHFSFQIKHLLFIAKEYVLIICGVQGLINIRNLFAAVI